MEGGAGGRPPSTPPAWLVLLLSLLVGLLLLGCSVEGGSGEGGDWDFRKCFVTEPVCPNQHVRFFLYTR